MLDRIAALAAAALLSLSSLPLSATALVGVELVTRSSLDGYDVAGRHGLDAAEAARALAERAVAEMDAAFAARVREGLAQARANDRFPRIGGDLLKAPFRVLGGRVAEVWRAGDAADARYRALYGSSVQRALKRTTRTGRGFLAKRVEVTFEYPFGYAVPAIEVAS